MSVAKTLISIISVRRFTKQIQHHLKKLTGRRNTTHTKVQRTLDYKS